MVISRQQNKCKQILCSHPWTGEDKPALYRQGKGNRGAEALHIMKTQRDTLKDVFTNVPLADKLLKSSGWCTCWTDRGVNRVAEGQRWPCFTKHKHQHALLKRPNYILLCLGALHWCKPASKVTLVLVHISFSFQLNMLLEKWFRPSRCQGWTASAHLPLLSIGIPSMHWLWIDLHSLPLVVSSVC